MEYWWWLSFADQDEGHNLGACIVMAPDRDAALIRSWEKGWNPGGEVAILGPIELREVPEGFKVERAYSRQELLEAPDMIRWPDHES